MDRLALVVPCYNEEENIGALLDAMTKQEIPKDKDAKALNLQDCLAIVADEANASKASARRATTKKAPRRPTKKSTK